MGVNHSRNNQGKLFNRPHYFTDKLIFSPQSIKSKPVLATKSFVASDDKVCISCTLGQQNQFREEREHGFLCSIEEKWHAAHLRSHVSQADRRSLLQVQMWQSITTALSSQNFRIWNKSPWDVLKIWSDKIIQSYFIFCFKKHFHFIGLISYMFS